jgi:hypothetical protein
MTSRLLTVGAMAILYAVARHSGAVAIALAVGGAALLACWLASLAASRSKLLATLLVSDCALACTSRMAPEGWHLIPAVRQSAPSIRGEVGRGSCMLRNEKPAQVRLAEAS